MKAEKNFRLSLSIRHPTRSAAEIQKSFSLPITGTCSYGEQRKTKSGRLLGGNYKHTWVRFRFHEKPINIDDVDFESFLIEKLNKVDFNYTSGIVKEGGKCELVMGLFTNDNVMFDIGIDTIALLKKASIGMSFDVYGGD